MPSQLLTIDPHLPASARGAISLPSRLLYDVSDDDKNLPGIGANLFFDSSQLSLQFSKIYQNNIFFIVLVFSLSKPLF